jgi:hypothetical protein
MSYGLTAHGWAGEAEGVDHPVDIVAGPTLSEFGLLVLPGDAPAQIHRTLLIPTAFAVPVLLSGLAYLGGGVPLLADAAFVVMTLLCLFLLVVELVRFGDRQGLGAILIYGGVLIWLSHDYLSNWLQHDYTANPISGVTADVICRVAFYHCLFVFLLTIGFRLPWFRFVDGLVVGVPEPSDRRFYVGLVVVLTLLGLSAFYWTVDGILVSAVKGGFWFLHGAGPILFTVTRTGNLNFNFGAYVAQLIQMGQVGGLMAAMYALLIARTPIGKILGWADWAYWLSYSFTSIRRGDIAFMGMPIMGIMFLKFHAQRDPQRQLRTLWQGLATGVLVLLVWIIVQKQSGDRQNRGVFDLFGGRGATMFSEGIAAWAIIPDRVPFAYNRWAGEGVLRPLPETLWWFVVDIFPRAIWHGKPIDTFGVWYSSYISRDPAIVKSGGISGTTVSCGAVGYWYFRYGPFGVIQGGLLFGWMIGVAERALRRAQGQPIKVLFAMFYATFLFRSYRDLWWHNLYPIVIAAVVLWLLVRLVSGTRSSGALHGAA